MDKEPDTPKLSPFERFAKAVLSVPAVELAKQRERYERRRRDSTNLKAPRPPARQGH